MWRDLLGVTTYAAALERGVGVGCQWEGGEHEVGGCEVAGEEGIHTQEQKALSSVVMQQLCNSAREGPIVAVLSLLAPKRVTWSPAGHDNPLPSAIKRGKGGAHTTKEVAFYK